MLTDPWKKKIAASKCEKADRVQALKSKCHSSSIPATEYFIPLKRA